MSRRTGIVSAVILTCVFLAGCSRFTNTLRTHEAERFAEEFEADLESDSFISVLSGYCDVDIPELLPEQRKIFDKVYEPDLVFDYIEVADSGNKGIIKTVIYYHDPAVVEDPDKFRTCDEWISEISNTELSDIKIDLDIEYVDGTWKFESFDEWIDAVMSQYSTLGILDDEGEPVNANAMYYEEYILDKIWYDPMLAIPLNSDFIEDPIALQCAFYFSKPISGSFECILRGPGGKKLGSAEVDLKESVISIFDFSAQTLEINKFEPGKYTMELLYNDEQIAVSEPLTVR